MSSSNAKSIGFCSFLPSLPKPAPVAVQKKGDTLGFFVALPRVAQKNLTRKPPPFNPKLYFGEHNILFIHDKIQEKIMERIKSIELYQDELQALLIITETSTEPVDRAIASHKLTKIRETIKGLETGAELLLYRSMTEKILERYKKICESEKRSFMKKDDSSSGEEKDKLVLSFLCIAQEYVDVEGFVQTRNKIKCFVCSKIMEFTDYAYICGGCGNSVNILDDTPSFKDISRVNTTSRYSYVRDGHFIKALKEFQGIHAVNKVSIENAEACLRDEMRKYNLTPEIVTKDQLYTFLEEQGLSNNYGNIHLLYSRISGVPCVDFSEYNSEIMDLFYKQEDAYEIVKSDGRDNSLIVNYKLLKVLQRLSYYYKLGLNYKKDDFYCLKTFNKRCEHDDVMEKAWNYLGWDWIPTT